MDQSEQKVNVKYSISENQIFNYTGFIVKEEADWIYFKDFKEGELRLLKARIILIKEVKQ
jgi:hypothetical protein